MREYGKFVHNVGKGGVQWGQAGAGWSKSIYWKPWNSMLRWLFSPLSAVVPRATEEFFPVGPLGDFSYFSTGCQKWWNLFFPLET